MTKAWQTSLPNFITISRILFVPLIVLALWENTPVGGYWAATFFILASLGDYFDGFFARKYKVESVMGKFLDPIADKILVTSTLVMMIPARGVNPVLVIILLSRDSLINGLRAVAASENLIIAAGEMGKWKTAIQMVAIPFVLFRIPMGPFDSYDIGIWALWLSVILSAFSGLQYTYLFMLKRR